MPVLNGKTCFRLELPLMEYQAALELQRNLVCARQTGILENDLVLLLEHPSVFTLGQRGGIKNLKVSKTFLERLNIPIVQVERGGDITFHGPGQLVVYPIIDLTKAGLKVLDYVAGLEEIMLRTASDWGICAKRNSANRGIWVEKKKLGSLGISVKRGVSFHGFALNVNLSLKPFKWINPCGLRSVDVTSMEKELSQNISIRQVREVVMHHFESVFGFELVWIDDNRLNHLVNRCATEDGSLRRSRSS